ncbi:MAG: carbohydrate porin [Bdellovibrionota bacterium]
MRLLASFLFVSFFSTPTFAADAEFHGYLRAGAGNNGKGAKEECIYNRGSPANEFRLGNECTIYGEAAFLARLLKPEQSKPWFNTTLRLAYNPPGNSSFENQPNNGQQEQVVEAFVEAGNVDGSPLTYWAGKRFYRDVDLYMFDWYYFAQMAGNGGGVGNIPLGAGKAAVAYLVETGSTRTNLGQNAVQVADVRWADVKIGERDALNFWGAYGSAPGGIDTTTNAQYVSRSGWVAGSRWRHILGSATDYNDFALLYGSGLMEGMNIYGTATLQTAAAPQNKAFRARAVEHLSFQPFSKLALHLGAAVESWDPKKANIDSRGLWWAVGVRPVYFFTDHWQLAVEAGHSEIRIRDERDSSGAPNPVRRLTRFTIAPQLSLGPSLWARPVIRAFVAQTFWNAPNKSFVAIDAPDFAGATSSQAIGVQTEVWF